MNGNIENGNSNLDLYWASNKDWYFCVGCIAVMREDAPPEAKESYNNCMRQLKGEKMSEQPE